MILYLWLTCVWDKPESIMLLDVPIIPIVFTYYSLFIPMPYH